MLRQLERALAQTRSGDVVEFGCYVGTTSLFFQRFLMTHYPSRDLHVYDSFEGLPEKAAKDNSPAGEQFKPGELRASKKEFISNFRKARVNLPIIHKGWFSEIKDQDLPPKIAFAFLDGDYYESIRTSLQLIESRLAKGAIIAVDDYSSEALPGARRAVEEWLVHNSNRRLTSVASLAIIYDGKEDRQ